MGLLAPLHLERKDRAAGVHLLHRQFVLGMAGQAREVDARHPTFQEFPNLQSVFALLLHT